MKYRTKCSAGLAGAALAVSMLGAPVAHAAPVQDTVSVRLHNSPTPSYNWQWCLAVWLTNLDRREILKACGGHYGPWARVDPATLPTF